MPSPQTPTDLSLVAFNDMLKGTLGVFFFAGPYTMPRPQGIFFVGGGGEATGINQTGFFTN